MPAPMTDDNDDAPMVVEALPVRTPRKIAVTAEPVTDTCCEVSCIASAASNADLNGIAIYVHVFGYTFEKGAEYTLWFDSQFMPRSIILNGLRSSGNAAKSYLSLPVPHAFSETIGRCFIQKHA